MKIRLWPLLLLLLVAPLSSLAQGAGYVSVTGKKACYANGSVQAGFINQSNSPQLPLLGGSTFPQTNVSNLDSSGTFTFFLADNNQIAPTPSQWKITVCAKSGGNPACGSLQIPVTTQPGGVPLDISTSIASFVCPANGTARPGGDDLQLQYNDDNTAFGGAQITVDRGTRTHLKVPSAVSGGNGGNLPATGGFITNVPGQFNLATDCPNVPTDHVTPAAAAINACLAQFAATDTGTGLTIGGATRRFTLPRTNLAVGSGGIACDYMLEVPIVLPRLAFELAFEGENGYDDTGIRLCNIGDHDGIDVNTPGVYMKGISVRGSTPWTPSNSNTYVLGGTSVGIRVCGGYFHGEGLSALWMSGDGIMFGSVAPSCQGPPFDGATSDGFTLIDSHAIQNRGNGLTITGSDGNVGRVIGGGYDQNQLFAIQDQSLYPATIIGPETNGNHHDTEGLGTATAISTVSVAAGVTTVTCPAACNIMSGDIPFISGNSFAGFNVGYNLMPAVSTGLSATSFTMLTGDLGQPDGSSGTGGTVAFQPGQRIWALANVYGGCGYENLVQPGTWIGYYCEGNEPALMHSGVLACWNCQGIAFAPYTAYNNGGVSPTFTNTQHFGTNPGQSYWNSTAIASMRGYNQFTRRMMGTFFRGANGTSGGGGIDAGWSVQAGAPVVGANEIVELGRSNTANNVNGHWGLCDIDLGFSNPAACWLWLYDQASTTLLPATLQIPGHGLVISNSAAPPQPAVGQAIADSFRSDSANPAASGAVRLANGENICWRNAANTADLCLTVDSGNNLNFNGTPITVP